MNFCDRHREQMRAAIMELGLGHRISKHEAQLRERLSNFDPFDVDPLYLLHQSIHKMAHAACVNNGVPAVLVACPCCFFREEVERAEWIENCAIAIGGLLKKRDAEKAADQERAAELHRQSVSA